MRVPWVLGCPERGAIAVCEKPIFRLGSSSEVATRDGRSATTHSVEERLESGILAHRIEFDRRADQNQRTVSLLEGAIEPAEEAFVIRQAKMDEREPHR